MKCFSWSSLFSVFIFTAFSSVSIANEQGKSLYQSCIACHGQNAEGNELLKAPALAGQFDWYLEQQVTNFKTGLRGSHKDDLAAKTMLPVLANLQSTADVKAVSQYLASLSPVQYAPKLTADMKNGYRYYQGKCGACHGDSAQGNKSFNAPKLAGLSSDYLALQMANFSKGVRGYHKDDKLGRQMAMMAKMTSGQELVDILFYIESQAQK